MASPLQTGKQPVNLAASAARGSRIRRDPPPIAKKTVIPDREERDAWTVAVGILTFTLAIMAIIAGVSSYSDWSPSDRVVHIHIE